MSDVSELARSNLIQSVLAALTFVAVLVAMFGQRFWNWVSRPKLEIEFDRGSERCFRWATVESCNVQDEGQFANVRKYYFRLRVHNGGGTVRNLRARVDVLDLKGRPVERFEPARLNWIVGAESVDLARGESEYVNLISQVVTHPEISNRLTIEVFNTNPRGIAWDRPLKSCLLEVTLYSDNAEPAKSSFKFRPAQTKDKPGQLLLLD